MATRRERLPGWLRRPGIGRRVALAMALSLVAIQLQAFAQIWLLARPEIRLVGTRWLAETTRDAAAFALTLPPDARRAALRERYDSPYLRATWSRERPWPAAEEADHALTRRFAATLRAMVGPEADIIVAPQRLEHLFPFSRVRVVMVPPGVETDFDATPLPDDAPDVPMLAAVRAAIRGADGSWVSVTPVGFVDGGPLAALPITPLVVGGLIIGIVSVATARRLLAPLDRLVETARRIGTARAVVPVPTDGLGEFAAVARAFEDIQHRLLRFDAERAQMLAAMSHDLRSALTRLRLAVDHGEGMDPDPAVLREIEDMQAMVESTLAFASGEAQPGARRSLDLAALLITMVDDAVDHGRPCSYAGPDHAEMLGSPHGLRRALWNLIDNAMKYGGVARVSLQVGPAAVRIEIADDGAGIPPHRVEEAFAPFRRLDPARSGRQPGVGLGLTIARDVIEGHGGCITVHIPPEGGSVVAVTLPVGEAQA